MSNEDWLVDSQVSILQSRAENRLKLECLRRILLCAGVFIAGVFYSWTDFKPYLILSQSKEQRSSQSATSENSLIRPYYTSGILKRRIDFDGAIPVEGEVWEKTLAKAAKAFKNAEVEDDWMWRLSGDKVKEVKRKQKGDSYFSSRIYNLYFFTYEKPFSQILDKLEINKTYRISSEKSGAFKLFYSSPPEITGFGGSVTGVPEAFAYPLRKFFWYPMLLGFLAYLFIPRLKRDEQEVSYPKASIFGCDLCSCILFIPFYFLPLLLAGGFIHALTNTIVVTAVLWFLAGLGLLILKMAAHYASFNLIVGDNEISLLCLNGKRKIRYEDIDSIVTCIMRPPKWLIIGSAAGGAFGSGGISYLSLGQSVTLSASECPGVKFIESSGNCTYVWGSSSGMTSLRNWQILSEKLDSESIKLTETPEEFRGIIPPDFGRTADSKMSGVAAE